MRKGYSIFLPKIDKTVLVEENDSLQFLLNKNISYSEMSTVFDAGMLRYFKSAEIFEESKQGEMINPARFIVSKEQFDSNRFAYPQEILIELTDSCNYNCIYCDLELPNTENSNTFLSSEVFDKMMDEFESWPLRQLIISGGEPLIWEMKYHMLFRRLKALRQKGCKITMFTNGTLLGQYINDVVSSVDILQVSIDTVNSKNFTKMTNSSARLLKRVKDIINKLKNECITINVNAVVQRTNIGDLDDLVSWGSRNKINKLILRRQYPLGKACFDEKYALMDSEWSRIVIPEDTSRYRVRYLNDNQGEIRHFPFGTCKAGRSYGVVNCDGTVSPCIGYKNIRIGNVEDETLKKIWGKSGWKKYRTQSVRCPIKYRQLIDIIYFK